MRSADFALGEAQRPHEFSLVPVAPRGERGGQRIERFARRAAEKTSETGGVFGDERPKIRRMIRQAEQQAANPLAGDRAGETCGLGRFQQLGETAARFRRHGEMRRVNQALSQRIRHACSRSKAQAAAASPRRRAG